MVKKYEIPDTKEPCRTCENGYCYNQNWCECYHPMISGSKVQIESGCMVKTLEQADKY